MESAHKEHLEVASEQDIFAKLFRFAISGLLTTALYFVLATFSAYFLGINPTIASGLAYLICIVISYFLQSRFTFRIRSDAAAQVMKFLFISFAGLALSTFVMKWAVDVQGLSYWIGALIVAVVIPLANFVIFSTWVFLRR